MPNRPSGRAGCAPRSPGRPAMRHARCRPYPTLLGGTDSAPRPPGSRLRKAHRMRTTSNTIPKYRPATSRSRRLLPLRCGQSLPQSGSCRHRIPAKPGPAPASVLRRAERAKPHRARRGTRSTRPRSRPHPRQAPGSRCPCPPPSSREWWECAGPRRDRLGTCAPDRSRPLAERTRTNPAPSLPRSLKSRQPRAWRPRRSGSLRIGVYAPGRSRVAWSNRRSA